MGQGKEDGHDDGRAEEEILENENKEYEEKKSTTLWYVNLQGQDLLKIDRTISLQIFPALKSIKKEVVFFFVETKQAFRVAN